jgi:hypothetical protein
MYPDVTKTTLAGGAATGAAALAFTGLDVGWFIAVGLLLVVGGLFLLRGFRIRQTKIDAR